VTLAENPLGVTNHSVKGCATRQTEDGGEKEGSEEACVDPRRRCMAGHPDRLKRT